MANTRKVQIETQKGRVMLQLFGTFLGGALILNSYILEAFFAHSKDIATLCSFSGAILLGFPVIARAINSLKEGSVKMMELAALAIIASFSLQEYQTAGIVAFFMLLAEQLQSRTALGARAAIENLIRLSPQEACRINAKGKEERILISDLKIGDTIRVRPGENIPADGEVTNGHSAVRQAEITGESLPVDKAPGSEVFAGTNNLTGVLEIKVTKIGDQTTLGKVKEFILKAESTRIPLMRLIDHHVGWYTPTILMIAGLILFFSRDIYRTITALVVTCPSSLILATPTALVAALSCAARFGILIKEVGYLETATQIDAVVFDKTGTLTTGNLTVTRLAPGEQIDPSHMIELAAAVEQYSNHPIAKAVVEIAKQANIALIDAMEMKEIPGKGVKARVRQNLVLVGRESWLREENIDFSALRSSDIEAATQYSTLFIAENNKCLGWIGLEDKTKADARACTDELRKLGVRQIVMLTGDRWTVAKKVSEELGCNSVQAECLPETKLQLVEEMKEKGYKVAVVGDGVNDAPALAAGDLGIAMGAAGSDVAIGSASITLLNDRLDRLPFLIKLARKTRWIVYQNLIFGALFIIFGLTLSGFGLLTPVIGAILHNIGAFVIIFNSARLVRFGEDMQIVISE
ncbi:MAG: cation-translocating P-type ATPase [Planctomycetes bacterium]|nr:cation-translocating P-type ATPase [Planctomycetota bacterium]HPY74747.1 cation-translocating P-type ATPase [Planctomycetota bacterium]HQB00389.1 cation-translocating P-type ATPase [Planctomycetota bacterium]HRU50673.1 cation-translocating P-type ATPase [Planctomycetota bacterium]